MKNNTELTTLPVTRQNVLTPFKSGAKILTGTKTVITNMARNTVHNVRHINQEIKKTVKPNLNDDVEIELDLDDDGQGDIEIEVPGKNIVTPIRPTIIQKAKTILKESLYEPPEQFGKVEFVRNVANPYNPKIKRKSLVEYKDRFKTKNDIYPKVKVDNSIMDKRVKKVRVYLYKVNGVPVARKQEHMPKEPFNPI